VSFYKGNLLRDYIQVMYKQIGFYILSPKYSVPQSPSSCGADCYINQILMTGAKYNKSA